MAQKDGTICYKGNKVQNRNHYSVTRTKKKLQILIRQYCLVNSKCIERINVPFSLSLS